MSLICLGLNHTTAPVELRERLAIPERSVPPMLAELNTLPGLSESVVVSTCNRVEIYAGAEPEADLAGSHTALWQYLAETFEIGKGGFSESKEGFYRLTGTNVVRHLFRVASGLDSMVLGETEIFGQVKKAYAMAHGADATKRNLNRLFQRAFQVGKRIRSETSIQHGATSIGSVAVELAEKIFGDLKPCQVMVIGAGDMSRSTAQSLVSRGAKGIVVSNRSFDRAEKLASEMAGRAIRFDDWLKAVPEVDIIVTSTSAPHSILHGKDLIEAMRLRRGRPLFLIDIAVPRDIDPSVEALSGVYLYDIDALEDIAGEAREKRQRQIEICEKVIDEEVDAFVPSLNNVPGRNPSSSKEGRGIPIQRRLDA